MLRDEVRETEIVSSADKPLLTSQKQVSIIAHGMGTLVDFYGEARPLY
ncbi:MAG TPA: hypothetical protein VLE70_06765 [Anaerolineae bacterium]|jgi:hypothetical protein|nr:hypothetical protein [Anaerolineae bacterium]